MKSFLVWFLALVLCATGTKLEGDHDEDYLLHTSSTSHSDSVMKFNWKDYTHTPLGQHFLNIDSDKIWVYGSFWDYRMRDREGSHVRHQENPVLATPPYVRVLLIGPYNDFEKKLQGAECVFYYDSDVKDDIERAKVTTVYTSHVNDIYPDNWTRPYYATCTPPKLDKKIPLSMSMEFPGQQSAQWAKDTQGRKRYFIWPIRGQYDKKYNSEPAGAGADAGADAGAGADADAGAGAGAGAGALRSAGAGAGANKGKGKGKGKGKRALSDVVFSRDIGEEIKIEKEKAHALDNTVPLKKLMLCVKPARNGVYQDYRQIIAFIAYYDMMGVTDFVLYDSGSFSPRIYKIFNVAAKLGINIEVQPWAMRENHGWANHQVLFNEICMYDAMDKRYDNVAILDFDEYLVPHAKIAGFSESPNLLEFIDAMDAKIPTASNFRFQVVCFDRMDTTPPESKAPDTDVDPELRKIAQNAFPLYFNKKYYYMPNPSTKHIYKPFRIGEVFIHSSVPANGNFLEVEVPREIANVHHYRISCHGVSDKPSDQQFKEHYRGEVGKDSYLPDNHGEAILKSKFLQTVVSYVNLTMSNFL